MARFDAHQMSISEALRFLGGSNTSSGLIMVALCPFEQGATSRQMVIGLLQADTPDAIDMNTVEVKVSGGYFASVLPFPRGLLVEATLEVLRLSEIESLCSVLGRLSARVPEIPYSGRAFFPVPTIDGRWPQALFLDDSSAGLIEAPRASRITGIRYLPGLDFFLAIRIDDEGEGIELVERSAASIAEDPRQLFEEDGWRTLHVRWDSDESLQRLSPVVSLSSNTAMLFLDVQWPALNGTLRRSRRLVEVGGVKNGGLEAVVRNDDASEDESFSCGPRSVSYRSAPRSFSVFFRGPQATT